MSHHLLISDNIHFSYPGGTPVLNGISFTIKHGESVAFVGANGAGKSTLLQHFNGTLLPNKGEVVVGNLPVTKKTLNQIRKTVGMVFQDPNDQLFMPTVFDDVAFGPLNLNIPKDTIKKIVSQTLELVGITHLKDKASHKLSMGQMKLSAIASVLSLSPDILVMDEPAANLDPMGRKNLIELLKKFTHTKIIATHDLDLALDLCDRIIVLNNGTISADDKTLDILMNENLLESNGLLKPLRLQNCPVCSKNLI